MSLGTLTREAGVCKKSSHAAVKSIAKPRDYPYEEVHVLLLQWEKSDNLGTTKHGHTDQVRELMRVLVESIHVTTCLWKAIPSTDSFRYLKKLLHDFKSHYSRPKNLLMAYYGGHGGVDGNGNLEWWNDRLDASLDWSSLQLTLECTGSDLVLLLDCCCSAASAMVADPTESRARNRTELIASSGFNSYSYRGKNSFTATLTAELKHRSRFRNTFSVVGLHAQVFARMREFQFEEKGCPATPVYVLSTGDERAPSIPLKVLPLRRDKSVDSDLPSEEDKPGELFWNEYEMGIRSYARVLTKHATPARSVRALA